MSFDYSIPHRIVDGVPVELTAEEIAARDAECAAWAATAAARTALSQRLATDEGERQAARVDAAILALVNATPAGLRAWSRANFPTLTQAEQDRIGLILGILAVAVRPIVR